MIINGNLKLNESSITSLDNLKAINGYLDLNFSEDLKSLGKLETINGLFLNLNSCYSLISLGNLKRVNGWLGLKWTDLSNLGNLEYVEGLIYLDIGSNITKEYVKKYKPQLFKQCRWNKETPNYA